MSKRVLILVEGQTEERFVKDVLGPAFWDKELFFHPTILVTKRVKDGPNFKGGVTNGFASDHVGQPMKKTFSLLPSGSRK